MPIFDDPGKALRRLEEELLEDDEYGEASEEEWEADFDDGYEEEDFPILTRRGSRPVNYAVDYDRTVYDDEETDDGSAYYEEDYRADRKNRKKRKKGVGGLILLALAELAGIAGVIWWWIQWLK
ncbi:MAG: hypothetical protein ACI3V5_09910 [Faecousia sp.]